MWLRRTSKSNAVGCAAEEAGSAWCWAVQVQRLLAELRVPSVPKTAGRCCAHSQVCHCTPINLIFLDCFWELQDPVSLRAEIGESMWHHMHCLVLSSESPPAAAWDLPIPVPTSPEMRDSRAALAGNPEDFQPQELWALDIPSSTARAVPSALGVSHALCRSADAGVAPFHHFPVLKITLSPQPRAERCCAVTIGVSLLAFPREGADGGCPANPQHGSRWHFAQLWAALAS